MAQAVFMVSPTIELLRLLSALGAAPVARLASTGPAAAGSDGTLLSSDNLGPIIGGIAVGGAAVFLIAAFWRRQRQPNSGRDRQGKSAWERRVLDACAEGKEIVDLTTVTSADNAGSGLSVEQLGVIESRLDLFVAHIRDVTMSAPSEPLTPKLDLAAKHAGALHDAVRTERTIRLSSTSTDPLLLDAIGLQLANERTSLDRELREIATVIARSS